MATAADKVPVDHRRRQPACSWPPTARRAGLHLSGEPAGGIGGPNCRGLPDMPSKQFGGTSVRSPFLVTDNAYILAEHRGQFNAPSTLQFLFNGAFAEQDDF